MLTPDPANHDDSYRYNVTVQNDKFLVEDFEYFYENKLTHWEDTLDDIIRNVLDADGLHPDKKLEKFDGRTANYINQHIHPFFSAMQHHYSEGIWACYNDTYLKTVAENRKNYIEYDYQSDLQEYTADQEERKALKAMERIILKSLKSSSPQKQADLIKTFAKEDQNKAKKIIADLIAKGRIVRGRKDVNSKGAWFLIFVK